MRFASRPDEAKEKIEGGRDVIPFTTPPRGRQPVHRVAPRFRRGALARREERGAAPAGRLLCLLLRRATSSIDDGVKDALIAEGRRAGPRRATPSPICGTR
ncbi:MAG: hypothetical protein ACLTSX_13435 [Collinsella sp.]